MACVNVSDACPGAGLACPGAGGSPGAGHEGLSSRPEPGAELPLHLQRLRLLLLPATWGSSSPGRRRRCSWRMCLRLATSGRRCGRRGRATPPRGLAPAAPGAGLRRRPRDAAGRYVGRLRAQRSRSCESGERDGPALPRRGGAARGERQRGGRGARGGGGAQGGAAKGQGEGQGEGQAEAKGRGARAVRNSVGRSDGEDPPRSDDPREPLCQRLPLRCQRAILLPCPLLCPSRSPRKLATRWDVDGRRATGKGLSRPSRQLPGGAAASGPSTASLGPPEPSGRPQARLAPSRRPPARRRRLSPRRRQHQRQGGPKATRRRMRRSLWCGAS